MPTISTPKANAKLSSAPYPARSESPEPTSRRNVGSSKTAKEKEVKKKKLPSCDSCKLRRVLCMPQAPPKSCPRCIEKGIVCTTTPVVRKKPVGRTGKRIEQARATFGAAEANAPNFAIPSNTPWIQPQVSATAIDTPLNTGAVISLSDLDTKLGIQEINGQVAAHLIELYQELPQSWLPLFARGRLVVQFEACGKRLEALPVHTQALAYSVIALTSRLSTHPLILGPGTPPVLEPNTTAFETTNKDLRMYGKRRDSMCNSLRQKALQFANMNGILSASTEDSMATCSILELLENVNPSNGRAYGCAFVGHLRALLDNVETGGPRVMNMSLGWSALLMREALFAVNCGRIPHFTTTDDLLLCGPSPVSIEEALLESVDNVDVRDSVSLFFRPMRPYTYHIARLAREVSIKITGTHGRRQPLEEHYVSKFLTQLDHLHQLLMVLKGRIQFLLSSTATAAHSLPAPFETQRQYIMKACLHTIILGWVSLTVPLYHELKRRISELKTGTQATIGERRRTRERLELLFKQVRRTALQGARLGASCVHLAPSLAFLTHLHLEKLGSWVEIIMDATPEEEGGEGITRQEKSEELQWINDALKCMGWSWTNQEPLIQYVESSLEKLTISARSAVECGPLGSASDSCSNTPIVTPAPESIQISTEATISHPAPFVAPGLPSVPDSFLASLSNPDFTAVTNAARSSETQMDNNLFNVQSMAPLESTISSIPGISGISSFASMASMASMASLGSMASSLEGIDLSALQGLATGNINFDTMMSLPVGTLMGGGMEMFSSLLNPGGVSAPMSAYLQNFTANSDIHDGLGSTEDVFMASENNENDVSLNNQWKI